MTNSFTINDRCSGTGRSSLHGFHRTTRSVPVFRDGPGSQKAPRAGVVLSLIPRSLSGIDGDSLGPCGRKTDCLLRQSDIDQLFPRSGCRSHCRQEKKVALWVATSSAADQRGMAVDCPFHHAADYCFGEQVLHTYSSTRALCESGGYLPQQRNRVRTAGSADRITLLRSAPLTGLLLGLGRQPCGDAVFRTLLAEVLFADAGNGFRGCRDYSASSTRTVVAINPDPGSVVGGGVFFGQSKCNMVTVLLHCRGLAGR